MVSTGEFRLIRSGTSFGLGTQLILRELYILNVFSAGGNIVENLMSSQSGADIYKSKKWESEKGLADVLDKLILGEQSNPKHQFKVLSMFAHTIDAIKEVVDKKDIEMIIMGTKGETHSRTTGFGSGGGGGSHMKTIKPVNKLKYLTKESPMPSKTEKRY